MINQAPIVFFGTEAWGVPCFEQLINDGYQIVAVVTRPDAPAGRKHVLTPTPVKVAALAHNLSVWEPENAKELLPLLTQLKPALGVLIAYGKIIPQPVLDMFPLGIINLHPSALPQYRGPSPVETAILNGGEVGHISIIKLDAAMDAGDIIASHRFELAEADRANAPETYRTIGAAAATLLSETVAAVLNGSATFTAQDETKVSLSHIITKADGTLDLTQSARQLDRHIRAYLGWPGSRTQLGGIDVIITAAHVGEPRPRELHIKTADGHLVIDRLIPAGKREMTGQNFLVGHPQNLS